ncbi:MAG: EamA family transporter [Caldilineaceae bacterium]
MKQMVLLLVTVALNVAGQFMMKRGMSGVGAIGGDLNAIIAGLSEAFLHPFVLGGVAAYGVSSICWLILLSRVDLSYAYPALSLGYVLITLVGALWLGESVTALRWTGVAIICAGVILVSQS